MNFPRMVLLTALLLLASCALMTMSRLPYQIFTLKNPSVIGESRQKQKVISGGFSGLLYEGLSSTGAFRYVTVTDRGPNTEATDFQGTEKRPFLMPDFNPEIIFLEADPADYALRITKRISLTTPRGEAVHGRPNTAKDELPSDTLGNELPRGLEGLDIEGLTKDSEGNFWMCEEYRPSLLKVSATGKILKRYVPKDSFLSQELEALRKMWGKDTVPDVLPALFGKRRANRGFEGIAFHQGKIIAALQSPLEKGGLEIPFLVFDPKKETSEVFIYPLENPKVDKIGDLASDGEQVLVVEQNSETGKKAVKKIFIISEFEKKNLKKKLLVDLGKLPEFDKKFDHEKIEGLAIVSREMLALVHDNDFGLQGPLSKSDGLALPSTDSTLNLMQLNLVPKQ